ncbi:cache domain-containing protein [Diaphorobacter caeni]|uniref:cache domain-containing protein n=1 Tax=Diaphorobacter caeni TaxID=2784387 RepID=UPI001E2A22CB|nr:cache domain-containing protein [Diaphorobacter caeni]
MATVPLGVALICMGITARHQTMALANEERKLVEAAYLHSKETELRHYVELARSTIERIAESGDLGEADLQAKAVQVVSRMKFGDNGYFFLYDQQGKLLVNPEQMAVANVDLCDPDTPAGQTQATLILDQAKAGGGLVRYEWHKPSSQILAPKLGYVLQVPGWNWVIGTGLYLDDVQEALARLDEHAKNNIAATQRRIYLIAALCMVLIAAAGVLLNLKDHRISSDKLRRLAQRVVHSQEEERARVARDLHDGVVQVLVSSKFLLETAQLQHQYSASLDGSAPGGKALDQGLARLNDALTEIRRVSHGLRPALLDDLGLPAALALLSEQMTQGGASRVHLEPCGEVQPIPNSHATALYRVAQEAVKNACTHAEARDVLLSLLTGPRSITLIVQDNGKGFDIQRVLADGTSGIGLRNMRERIEALDGQFSIAASRLGTRIVATLPLRADAGSDAALPHSRFDSSYAPA